LWAERFAIGRADAVTAPSRYVLDFVQNERRHPLKCAKVIPNPAPTVLDAQRWSPQTRDRDRVLFVGRFDRVKGPDILLNALERLVDRRPELKLDLVGPDRGLDEATGTIYLADFLQQRVSPRLRGRVTVHGSLPPSAIASIRRSAHVTVVPSRFESFSMTALEALAAGCPLVASDAGGIPEVVRDGVSGLLFRSEDTAHLAARIEEILSNDALAESLSREAVSDCATRFSSRSVAEQSLEVYEAARERRRRR
jgi:glycosyltransferase involved in cell wall biosynthesis